MLNTVTHIDPFPLSLAELPEFNITSIANTLHIVMTGNKPNIHIPTIDNNDRLTAIVNLCWPDTEVAYEAGLSKDINLRNIIADKMLHDTFTGFNATYNLEFKFNIGTGIVTLHNLNYSNITNLASAYHQSNKLITRSTTAEYEHLLSGSFISELRCKLSNVPGIKLSK